MRYISLLFLILPLFSCEDEGLPGGVRFLSEAELELQKRPIEMVSFRVDGVPDKNIRFVALDKHQPSYNRILVTLPENYAKGEKVTARVKLTEGFVIRDYFLREYDPGNLELDFARTDGFWLLVYDKKNDRTVGDFYVYVDPTAPITAPSRGKKYEETLGEDGVFIFAPLKNLGTASTINTNDSLDTHVKAKIRNIKTGKVYTGTGAYFIDNPDNDLFVQIPAEAEEGEYAITIHRKERHVVLPDPVVLTYGEPGAEVFRAMITTAEKGENLKFNGYNLRPSYKYRLELSNDFGQTHTLKPFADGHRSLVCTLPQNVLPGNYQAKLYINEKQIPVQLSFKESMLAVKSRADQPVLTLISDEQHVVYWDVPLYEPVSVLQKRLPVIADFRDAVREESVLFFRNISTGTEYEIPLLDFTPAMYSFPRFKIPVNVPVGQYEVRSRHGNKWSERYHRIIRVE